MDRFKLNPKISGPIMLEKVSVTSTTVLTGERWRKWTKSQFPGQLPKLVLVTRDGKVLGGKATSQPKKAEQGKGSRVVLATGPAPKPVEPEPEPIVEPEPIPEPLSEPEMESLEEDDLTQLEGVGSSRLVGLQAAGYTTFKSLAEATAVMLVSDMRDVRARLSVSAAHKIIKAAQEKLGYPEKA